MMRKNILFLVLFSAVAANAEDITALIGKNHEFFSKAKNELIVPDGKKNLFMWTTEARDAAYYPADPESKETFTLFGFKVCNANVRFEKKNPSRICLTLFESRNGEILTADAFRQTMKKIYSELRKRYPNVKAKLLKRTENYLHLNAVVWISGKYACVMKWGIKGNSKIGEEPIFLQIEFETVQPGKNPLRRSVSQTVYDRPYGITANRFSVKRETNGDVFLDKIPMVDQGAKGNSAEAVIQRILEYHGIKPEKPIAAEKVKDSEIKNSDIEELHVQLKKICSKSKLKIKENFIYFNGDRSLRRLQNLLGKYNRMAKSSGNSKLEIPQKGKAPVAASFRKMKPEVLVKVRKQDHAATAFQAHIKENVMNGQPLVWYTVSGVIKEDDPPEKPPVTQMRLIIGFNDTERSVIYSDSRGEGHEFKSMSFDNAWAITLAAYTISIDK